jgi:hypothetical protein
MMIRGASLSSVLAVIARRVCGFLGHVPSLFAIDPGNSYRPEVHYMRGPGPKWREKHARAER